MADDIILHKVCIVCGKPYDTPRSNPRKTCSKECEFEARSRINRGKPSPLRLNLTGQTYGELTAVRRLPSGKWLWRCSCGKEVELPAGTVRNNPKRRSCGHVRTQRAKERITRDNVLGFAEGTSTSLIRPIVEGRRKVDSETGIIGVRVRHNVGRNTYTARITYQGKTIHLGTFATLRDAADARKRAEAHYFGRAIQRFDARRATPGKAGEKEENP